MRSRIFAVSAAAIIVVAALVWLFVANPKRAKIRIAITPYPDTMMPLYGIDKGIFRDAALELEPVSMNWDQQIDRVAGGGVDIAMTTLDGLVAKSKNLHISKRPVIYIFPAWLFEGLVFVSRSDIKSLAEISKSTPDPVESRRQFLQQIKTKRIALPFGTLYDTAIRDFIRKAGENPDAYRLTNVPVETGLDGLQDEDVGLTAAPIVARLEAQRRGHKIALDTVDLDVIVLTGFICREDFFLNNRDAVDRFVCAWFKCASEALNDIDKHYDVSRHFADINSAKVASLEEFKLALTFQTIPVTPSKVREMFLTPSSPTYWQRAWNSTIVTLRDTGKGEDIPSDTADFRADDVISVAEKRCPGGNTP